MMMMTIMIMIMIMTIPAAGVAGDAISWNTYRSVRE